MNLVVGHPQPAAAATFQFSSRSDHEEMASTWMVIRGVSSCYRVPQHGHLHEELLNGLFIATDARDHRRALLDLSRKQTWTLVHFLSLGSFITFRSIASRRRRQASHFSLMQKHFLAGPEASPFSGIVLHGS